MSPLKPAAALLGLLTCTAAAMTAVSPSTSSTCTPSAAASPCVLGLAGAISDLASSYCSDLLATPLPMTSCDAMNSLSSSCSSLMGGTASTLSPASASTSTSSRPPLSTGSFEPFPGLTQTVQTSPASCYSLPTPTASLTVVSYNDTQAGSDLPSAIDFFVDAAGQPAGFYGLQVNGSQVIYDFSGDSQLAMAFPEQDSALVINATGMFLFVDGCSAVVAVLVPDFAADIAQLAGTQAQSGSSPTSRRRGLLPGRQQLGRRASSPGEVDFTVFAFLMDTCNKAVTSISPLLSMGNTSCTLVSAASGHFAWACQFPGANSREQLCEQEIVTDLGYLTGGFVGSTTNWGAAVGLLVKYFPGTALSYLSETVVALVSTGFIVEAIAALAALQLALTVVGTDNVAHTICEELHGDEPEPLVLTAPAYATTTLTTYTDPNEVQNVSTDVFVLRATNAGHCSTTTTTDSGGAAAETDG